LKVTQNLRYLCFLAVRNRETEANEKNEEFC